MCSSWPPASSTGPADCQSTCRRAKGQQLARCSGPIPPPRLVAASCTHTESSSILLTAVQTPAHVAQTIPHSPTVNPDTHSCLLQGTEQPCASRKHSEPGFVPQHRAVGGIRGTELSHARAKQQNEMRHGDVTPAKGSGGSQTALQGCTAAEKNCRDPQSISMWLKQNTAQPAIGFPQVEERSCYRGTKQEGSTTAANLCLKGRCKAHL